MIKVNKLLNIEAFNICKNGRLILLNNKGNSFSLYKEERKVFEYNKSFLFYEISNEKIFIIQNQEGEFSIDFEGNVVLPKMEIKTGCNYLLFQDFGISYLKKGETLKRIGEGSKPGECELFKNLNFVWRIKYYGRLNFWSDKFIFKTPPRNSEGKLTENQFSRLSFETGERLWDFDLDEHLDKLVSAYPYEGAWLVPDHHPQIKEPIGVYKDQLWFSMKHYGLLCLNYHTGAFMYYLRDCPENDKGWPYMLNGKFPLIPFTENAIIIENEGKMICFDSVMYWELNLETLQIDFHFLEDYLKNEVQCYTTNTRFKKLIVENEKIYMVDNLHKKFGCFNRRTLKYDWIEPLPEGSGAPRSIEKHGNRLYIDTSKKELLVYELEDNE